MTLNTNGCLKMENNQAGGGGLLRDHSGIWINGFSIHLGMCSIVKAELWALLYGLNLVWNRGVHLLEVEVDSFFVRWILIENVENSKHSNLIRECKQLLSRIYRE